jgi:hypothetical protein
MQRETNGRDGDAGERRRLLVAGAALAALAAGAVGIFAAQRGAAPDRAERLAARTPGRPGAPGPMMAGGPPSPEMRKQMEQRIAGDLGLSAAQQEQFRKAQETVMPQVRAVMEDKSLTDDQRRERMMQMREQADAQMRTILTPEQQAKFDAQRREMQARMEEMRGRMAATRERYGTGGEGTQQMPFLVPPGGPGEARP